ncbi:UNVERIFIED_ORG: hypothetical protein DFS12_105270 [Chitinophaga ginsengisegetis]|nr:hypothetical protein [Chitinophaga ginsengisegetis]MDR6648827.1 hypothetical protein [Chitinophaga ginsengisegetis]MDR6655225.1 hypothetical protein [Chitinophaga ginsengisegetis]
MKIQEYLRNRKPLTLRGVSGFLFLRYQDNSNRALSATEIQQLFTASN